MEVVHREKGVGLLLPLGVILNLFFVSVAKGCLVMPHRKVALGSIKTLTFYASEETKARRTSPIRSFSTSPTPSLAFIHVSQHLVAWSAYPHLVTRRDLHRLPILAITGAHLLNVTSLTHAFPAQLTCIGKPCASFQPEVVQCTNMGDDGSGGVQWRVSVALVISHDFKPWAELTGMQLRLQCDTDLPHGLRMGKVEVSCEGWSGPGDMNVLQGESGVRTDGADRR